jgi:hypothetical protein
MPRTLDQIVNSEVHYCVSYLVSTLANGCAAVTSEGAVLRDMAEQAFELACPIDDWEEAAFQAGWTRNIGRMTGTATYSKAGDKTAHIFDGWQDLCESESIEPYQREVFEHWIVSDWLADQLEARGEKVDRDFAGMIVWARTTSGQGIASDSVIEAIAADLNRAA